MLIGILALQGAVEPHEQKLKQLGSQIRRVKTPDHLTGLSGIILPGGESSTMIHLLKLNSLWEPLNEFVQEKRTWGICAGAILLAKQVTSPEQASFQAIDISVERNAYGRQSESFSTFDLIPTEDWYNDKKVEGVFIRAPKILEVRSPARTLFKFKGEPVLVEQGKVLASTFHPELTDSNQIHQYFLQGC